MNQAICCICARPGRPPSVCAGDFYQQVDLRDEARAAARELLALLQSSAADHDHDLELFKRWPWLDEDAEENTEPAANR